MSEDQPTGVAEGEAGADAADVADANVNADVNAEADRTLDPESAPSGPRTKKPVVVVVEPETPGNVGTIARAMKNFGLYDLKLVDPPELDEDGEAYGFAGHAREDVLPNADEITFEEVVENYHTIGTTAITGEDARSHVRFPFKTPREVVEDLKTVESDTAIVFGREGKGLNNEELGQLDEVCAIPADERYPVMNLGQAANVILYELRELTVENTQLPDVERERADAGDIERFHEYFSEFLDNVDQRDHRKEKAETLVRRLFGRAHPTEREIHTLLGVLRKANTKLENAEELADRFDEPLYGGNPRSRNAERDDS
ncbi:RNA methyltransferase [Haloparvum sp. PAK95]|uniref:RNA methyltransferase n=1 Tax=Haloparvum sp. PAK95 TaxID=3418962 RepID=UPI003D2F26B7